MHSTDQDKRLLRKNLGLYSLYFALMSNFRRVKCNACKQKIMRCITYKMLYLCVVSVHVYVHIHFYSCYIFFERRLFGSL